jgi:hypothetical protein
VLLFPQLKLLRMRCLNSSLHFLNLISVKGFVVKNLPLFGSALVKVKLLFSDLLLSYYVLDPVL